MAKNPQVESLFDDEDRIDMPETDIKYKEIKDKNMPSHRSGGVISASLASPINCDIAHVGASPGAVNNRRTRAIGSVLEQENELDDTDNTAVCPTCRGTGTIHAGAIHNM
jgi:hypothetical protein